MRQDFQWGNYYINTQSPPLFPYQKRGVVAIERKGGRVLLADEPGLGKTCQALVWMGHKADAWPVVIVCPASLKLNWAKEIRMWLNDDVDIHIIKGGFNHKSKPIELDKNNRKPQVVIMNYDVAVSWFNYISGFQTVILDESHYIKNIQALRTKATLKIAGKAEYVVAISGTPILAKPIEAFTTLNLIAPDRFPSWWNYANHYCDLKKTRWGIDVSGSSNPNGLKEWIKPHTIRRLKENVLTDLPQKRFATIETEMSAKTRKDYDAKMVELMGWKQANVKGSKMQGFGIMEALKQVCLSAKIDAALEIAQSYLDADTPLVVFGIHKALADAFEKKFKDQVGIITGSTSAKRRNDIVNDFQAGKIKLFYGNIQAAGTGITLTAASNMLMVEYPWSPGDYQQANDRVHRIGQANAVLIHNLVVRDTMDEIILRMLLKKQEVVRSIMDDGQTTESDNLFEEVVMQLAR